MSLKPGALSLYRERRWRMKTSHAVYFVPLVLLQASCMHLGMFGTHQDGTEMRRGTAQTNSSIVLGSYSVSGTFEGLRLNRLSRHQISISGKEPPGLSSRTSVQFLVDFTPNVSDGGGSQQNAGPSLIHREEIILDQLGSGTVTFTPEGSGTYVLRYEVTIEHADLTSMTGEVVSEQVLESGRMSTHSHGMGMGSVDGLWLAVPILMMGAMLLFGAF